MPHEDAASTHSNAPLPRRFERRRRAMIAQRRRRKIQALLAGGLVLGVGASATVAAWTDQEDASGEFQAGVFGIEANVNGTWNSEGQMQFDSTNMYPGQDVYASVSIRSSPDTTMDGEITVAPSETTGALAEHLSYRVAVPGEDSSPECGPSSFDPSGAALVPLSNPPETNDPHEVSSAGQNVVEYCFHVHLDENTPNAMQGESTRHTWVWNATSIDDS